MINANYNNLDQIAAEHLGMRTYIEVPYEEKDEAKALGARWDKYERQWYIPLDVPVEQFGEFARWFPSEIWYRAPLCPEETEPCAWGRTLFDQLKSWAEAWKLGPSSLKYWDIRLGTPPIEVWDFKEPGSEVVQVVWPRGPYCWAISLLHGQSYHEWGPTIDGVRYYLQPSHYWSFSVDSFKV